MKNIHHLMIILLLSIIVTGCSTSGAFYSANLTEVQLTEANYEVVATNVTGEATSGYILGASTGIGYQQMQTFAIARVSGSGKIYGEAIEDLWQNFRKENGDVEGRNLALVNLSYDTDALNLFLYTQPQVSVRADVIEFKE
ncbi:DUF6567 family protein [Fodinibius sp. AD559]|uniref:DUF6567 family protein n=1 Tax=Fodinibius sp. AD559 TaxID=3424179 RepID=UPI004046B74A